MNKVFFVIFLLSLSACSTALRPLVLDGKTPLTASAIGRAPVAPTAIAIDNSAKFVAVGGDSLWLIDLHSGARRQLLNDNVDALCWSFDGRWLAVAQRQGRGALLKIFSHSGLLVNEIAFEGRLVQLLWPPGELLYGAELRTRSYRFGTHLDANFYIVATNGSKEAIDLYETTISPAVAARLEERVYQPLEIDLSPLKDELLYTRIFAPPAFAAERRLVIRNLVSEAERQVSAIPLNKGAGYLQADGESLLVAEGDGQVRQVSLWKDQQQIRYTADKFAYHRSGPWLMLGQRLRQDRGDLDLVLPDSVQLYFSSNGQQLILKRGAQLYLLKDLPVDGLPQIEASELKTWLKLRKLRSLGLISHEEYHMAKERLSL